MPTLPHRTQLDIAAATARTTSPEHKRFQTLLAKIGRARKRLQAWQEQLPVFAKMYAERAAPLEKELRLSQRAWAFELEVLLGAHRWSRTDAKTLSALICELCDTVLSSDSEPDAEVKALYNRHAEVDYDAEDQQNLDVMKSLLEGVSGLDLGEEPIESPEELLRRAWAKVDEQVQQASEKHAERTRKPARKSAAQKRAEEDARRISQTVREVYRKLASALHPDRARADLPEAERAQRTALMQRANTAYEADDLLALLELQLQIEQVDLAHAANVAAEQVRHFNKVLAEQLRELEAEIDERQIAFCESYGLMIERRLDPAKLGSVLNDELRDITVAQARVQIDRRLYQGDLAQVKRLLKRRRAEEREMDLDDLFF